MMIVNREKPLKVLLLLRPSLHCEKVDDLYEQTRFTTTRFPHNIDKLAQTRNEPIVANAKQRTTRNVAYTGRFDHEHSRTPFSESSVPVKILLRDEPIFSRTPRHHRRHPRAAARFELPDRNRTEQSRPRGFFGVGPARLEYLVTNWISEFPHVPSHRLHGLQRFA